MDPSNIIHRTLVRHSVVQQCCVDFSCLDTFHFLPDRHSNFERFSQFFLEDALIEPCFECTFIPRNDFTYDYVTLNYLPRIIDQAEALGYKLLAKEWLPGKLLLKTNMISAYV
jgi:hypothetical protein